MLDFAEKVLLLTGANGGIPRAIASIFRESGASLVLTDIDVDALQAFGAELDPAMKRVVVLRQDASKREDADAAVRAAQESFGGIDYVVTGAGVYRDKFIQDMTDEEWRETLGVNLDGVFFTCRAALPVLRDRGAIVNIASIAGHRGSYQHGHYSAAKGAVLSFTRSLALELAPRARANAVSPGFIDTPFVKGLLPTRGPGVIAATPLKRLGRADEVARAVAFLCSDWASFITGETLHVNGGLHIAS